ncbi:MAG TPA: phosphopantetheine-binding protein [Pyrinomonadaceae bacterium]|jgi:acyl carrier protein|nr:phosphopantetheine-binding protein [Pyrinomonadaceae bacterium]
MNDLFKRIEKLSPQKRALLAARLDAEARADKRTPEKRLVAYVTPASAGVDAAGAELRDFLRQQLPDYMIPSSFVFLEELPLMPNGKIDRRALPSPDSVGAEPEREFIAPRNRGEESVARIWADLLGIERVGVYDNFFELGGHSLLATQLVSRLREFFRVEMPLRVIFEQPTVAGLAMYVEEAGRRAAAPQAPAITAVSRQAHRMKRPRPTRDVPASNTSRHD